uniref:Putative ixodes 8-cys protein n=1 Tax=Ixodes ricinus TaxID=34613 RepID=A0A0K8R3A3_IXORI
MFKLKFFILFVLAGLCFGDTSASETGSGNGEGESNSSGAAGTAEVGDTSAGQVNTGEKSGESGDDGKSKEGEKATAGNTSGNNKAGHTLPDFIGSEKNKKDYVTRLVDLCTTKHSLFKINEHNISFATCTFTCLSSTPSVTSVNERIPEGMICNDKNTTCPGEGPCPPLPVPNC